MKASAKQAPPHAALARLSQPLTNELAAEAKSVRDALARLVADAAKRTERAGALAAKLKSLDAEIASSERGLDALDGDAVAKLTVLKNQRGAVQLQLENLAEQHPGAAALAGLLHRAASLRTAVLKPEFEALYQRLCDLLAPYSEAPHRARAAVESLDAINFAQGSASTSWLPPSPGLETARSAIDWLDAFLRGENPFGFKPER